MMSNLQVMATCSNQPTNEDYENLPSLTANTMVEDPIDIQDFVFKFNAMLYAKSSLPLSQATDISNKVQELSKLIVKSIKQKVDETTTLEAAKNIFQEKLINFNGYKNDKTFKAMLKQKGLYFEPSTFVVSNQTVQIFTSGCVDFKNIINNGTIMPIEDQLKAFLELPGVFKEIMMNQNTIDAEYSEHTISHLCHGQKWRTIKENNPNKILIPITLYNDDFQVDDCVGAHSGVNSISAFYYQIATLPQHLMSRLSFIFIALLAFAKDLKVDSVDPALYALVEVFTHLEINGLTIRTEGGNNVKVHFVLFNFVGDNLGLHIVCGFVHSFTGTYCCRFCTMHYDDMQTTCRLTDNSLARTIDQYDELLNSDNYADHGITRHSILNMLPNFHVLLNRTADIMHDLLLGVFKYDLQAIFRKYVHSFNHTLDFINGRIAEHAKIEGFKLSNIKLHQLVKGKNINMNAREVWFVVEHLALILPSPKDENEREVFDFAMLMGKLLQICLRKSFSKQDLQDLLETIVKHHQKYIEISGEGLKPKFHFLLHYPEIIRSSGPIRLVEY